MENIKALSKYSDLVALSESSIKPVLVALLAEGYTCLMCEVIESLAVEHPDAFQLIKLSGKDAQQVQSELSILNLPTLIIFHEGQIKAIFNGLIAEHEIMTVLSALNY